MHLFFGARYRCELYDLPTLWQIASHNPWLSVSPVSEYNSDPPWAADYPDVTPPRGLHVHQTGRLPDVVTRYGGWGDRQILICGGPAMVARHQSRADRQRRSAATYPARPAVQLSRRLTMHVVTLRDPSSPVAAQFVPEAGMIGISLTDAGVELLGQRRGLDAYIDDGKTMGIPILYPWANRLGANTYQRRRRRPSR